MKQLLKRTQLILYPSHLHILSMKSGASGAQFPWLWLLNTLLYYVSGDSFSLGLSIMQETPFLFLSLKTVMTLGIVDHIFAFDFHSKIFKHFIGIKEFSLKQTIVC